MRYVKHSHVNVTTALSSFASTLLDLKTCVHLMEFWFQ